MRAKLALGILALACCLKAQTIIDVDAMASAALAGTANLFTIAGPDGTSCNMRKLASPTIYAVWTCGSADGKNTFSTGQIKGTSTAPATGLVGWNAVSCIIAVNPTSAPVSFGNVGTAPAKGIVWSCVAGAAPITGTGVWP